MRVKKKYSAAQKFQVALQCFLEAIVHNMKKAIRFVSPEVSFSAT